MVKLVKDATIKEILNKGFSIKYYDLDNEDPLDDWVYQCEICNSHFELRMDVLDHIIECHMDEELPETFKEQIKNDYEPDKQKVTIDPDELELC